MYLHFTFIHLGRRVTWLVAYSGTGSRRPKRARFFFFFLAGRVIDGWGGGLQNDRPTEYRSNLRALDWRTCRQRACRENTTALFAVVAFSPDKWIDQIRRLLLLPPPPAYLSRLPPLRNLFPSPLRRERRRLRSRRDGDISASRVSSE